MVSKTRHIILYTKDNCPLCDDAVDLLSLFKSEYPYTLEKRNIFEKEDWVAKYRYVIPVIEMNGKQLKADQINYEMIEQLLQGNHYT